MAQATYEREIPQESAQILLNHGREKNHQNKLALPEYFNETPTNPCSAVDNERRHSLLSDSVLLVSAKRA